MSFCNAMNDRQSQPGALPHLLRRKERLKNSLLRFRIHAPAGIPHFEYDMRSRTEVRMPARELLRHLNVAQRYGYKAS